MGREKRNLLAGQAGGAKERHKRAQRSQYDPKAPVPEGLVAKPAIPKSKHQSYFEFVENKEKKKKLEFKITTHKTPPPGFEFVPIGNPELTTACKELSREKDAMIFIVSNSKDQDSNILAHQVHRIGHHIRETIVDEARASIGQALDSVAPLAGGSPEPIPESQEEYNAQVDATIRDLFPRIPNTDRQMIIEHAFKRGTTFKGDKPVGLSEDITLARRVQLAVLAHIRHTHTRYDDLLKETTWQNARKVVEALCLDTLVKWRGDEETGRDQLDEILREVVVISDSEDDDSDDETGESSFEEAEPRRTTAPVQIESNISSQAGPLRRRSPKAINGHHGPQTPARVKSKVKKTKRKTAAEKKGQRGFKRYHAWQEAIRRFREEPSPDMQPSPMDRTPNPNYLQHQPAPLSIAPYTSNEFIDPSEPRISASGAGPAPTENGYVAQAPSYVRHPVNIVRRSYSPLPRAPIGDKVMFPGEMHRDSPVSHRPVSLVTNRLQDMLLPSIEPASPEAMRPSFVRTVPPRGQAFGNGSPIGSHMRHSPRGLSPLKGGLVGNEPVVVTRRVIHRERFAPPEAYDDGRGYISNPPRDQEYVSAGNGYPISTSPIHRSDGRSYEPNQLPIMAATRMPHPEIIRPEERPSTTILMEDRGGFYERVSTHPNDAHPLPRTTRVVEFRQPSQIVRKAPEPHRVVPLHEGPRILRESRSNPRIRTIPATSSHSLPYDREPRMALANPPFIRSQTSNEIFHSQALDREYYPIHSQPPRPEPRPMSGDRVIYREGLYREMPNRERPSSTPLHDQPVQRRYENAPPSTSNQRTPRRGFPLHPHRPEDVIVIE